MSNKYFLFPLCGIVVPLLIYAVTLEFHKRLTVVPPTVGEIIEHDNRSEPVVFTGDVLLARNVEVLTRRKGNSYPFLHSQSIFLDANTIIGNFESAILKKHTPTPAYVTTFSTDVTLLPLLSEAGFSHVTLANNHSYDYGAETFTHTVTALTDAAIAPFGHPLNSSSSLTTTFTSGDYTVGLLGLNAVFTKIDWDAVIPAVAELSKMSDYQVAYIHWGDEYVLKHNATQEEIAKKLIDLGIDAVIGHHPHVTQDIQLHNGKPIFYSLGNFLFDQYFSVDVQQGLVLRMLLSTSTVEFALVPVSSEGTLSQPHRMNEPELGFFLRNLARRSDPALTENIVAGKVILPLNLATYPQNGMIAP